MPYNLASVRDADYQRATMRVEETRYGLGDGFLYPIPSLLFELA